MKTLFAFKLISLIPTIIGLTFIVDAFLPQKEYIETITSTYSEINTTFMGSSEVLTEHYINTNKHEILTSEDVKKMFLMDEGTKIRVYESPLLSEIKAIQRVDSNMLYKTGIFHSSMWFAILPFMFLTSAHMWLYKDPTISKSAYSYVIVVLIISVWLLMDYFI